MGTTYQLTVDFGALLDEDVTSIHAAYVRTNLPAGSVLVDKTATAKSIKLGLGRIPVARTGGETTVTLLGTANTGLNVAANTLRYEVIVEYASPGQHGLRTWSSGFFPLTANSDLKTLLDDVDPIAVQSASTYALEAKQYRDEAASIAELDTSDALVATLLETDTETGAVVDAKIAAGIAPVQETVDEGRLSEAGLSATYAALDSPALTGTPTVNGLPIGSDSFVVSEDPNATFGEGQILFVVEPIELGDLLPWTYHYDAGSLAVADGAEITSWASGSGSATLAKTSATGPTLDLDGLAGGPAAVFGGSSYMDTPAFASALNGTITVVVVGSMDVTVNSEQFFDSADATGANRVSMLRIHNAGNQRWMSERGATQVTPQTPSDNNPHVFICTFRTSGGSTMHIDGVAVAGAGTFAASTLPSLRIGARYSAGNILNGKIGFLGIINRELTADERTQVGAAVAETWAI